jgi:hypothetical protein
LPDSEETALRRKAPPFAKHLSSLFTRTITDHALRCEFVFDQRRKRHNALIRFRDTKGITLGNGCRIRVLQRILLNPDDSSKVTTAEYQYMYGFSEDLDNEWTLRYEYVPEEAEFNPKFKYPVGHVHFNGISSSYERFQADDKKPYPDLHCPTRRIAVEDFIEHLITELRVPTKRAESECLELLDESRKTYEGKKTKPY